MARSEFYFGHHLYEMDPGVPLEEFEKDAVALEMPAGSLECHHPYTPHSSPPNESDSHRRAIIMRFQPDTEPVVSGPFAHWKTGETCHTKNYLLRGTHPLLEPAKAPRRGTSDAGTSGLPETHVAAHQKMP